MKSNNVPSWIFVHGEGAPAIVRDDLHRFKIVKNYHISLGWGDIAYHAFVERDGTLVQGRKDHEIGTHATKFNDKSLAICLAGASDIQPYTEAQIATMKKWVIEKMQQYSIQPEKVKPHRYVATYATIGGAYIKNDTPFATYDGCKPYKNCYGSLYDDAWLPETLGFAMTLKRDLVFGESSPDVVFLQRFLKAAGFFDYPTATGYYGEITRRAVLAFQKAFVLSKWKWLTASGQIVGPRTRKAINEFYKA